MRMLPWVTECDILCGLGSVPVCFWSHLLWTISLMHKLLPHPLADIAVWVCPLHSAALLASLPFCQAPSSMTRKLGETSALSIKDNSWSPMKGFCGKGVMPIKGDGGMMTKSESHALCPKTIHGFMTYYERECQVPPGSPNHSMRESLSQEGLCAVFPAQGLGYIIRVISRLSNTPTLKTHRLSCSCTFYVWSCLFLWKIAHFQNNAHSQG